VDPKKRVTKILLAVIILATLAAVAAWQFYLFAVFKDATGAVDLQGGTIHLAIAIGIALIVSVGGFFVFSRLVRYDSRNELHITSQGQPLGVGRDTK
jgi:predicted MFS family arabinose efflux permease